MNSSAIYDKQGLKHITLNIDNLMSGSHREFDGSVVSEQLPAVNTWFNNITNVYKGYNTYIKQILFL
jgi:hypothetical protein